MKTQKILVFCMLLVLGLTLGACSDNSSGGGSAATKAGTDSSDTTTTTTAAATPNPADSGTPGTGSAAAANPTETSATTSADRKPDPATKKPVAPKKRVTGGPSISFDEMRHDFGSIYEGAEVRHTFKFTNVGDEPLIISRVKSSCGCTVAKEPKDPVAPGAESEIEVVFNSAKRFGEQKKDISVFTNDPKRPMQKLRIETVVIRQFWIDPARIYLGSLTKSQDLESKTLKVYWSDEIDLNVTNIKTSDDTIKVSQKPFEDAKGKGVELTVDFGKASALTGPAQGPMQRISQVITVETDNEQFKSNNIAITGNIIPEITIRPRVLSFGVLSKTSKPVTKKLIVTAAKDFDLLPPTVDSDLGYLSFDIKEIRAKKQYQIVATLDPSGAPEGQFRKNINIRTNSEEYGKNDIPVFGKVK